MKYPRLTPSVLILLLTLASLFAGAPLAQALDDLVISEFMAENDGILPDENGDYEDWIEIYNAGTNDVNLLNWSLTDNPNNLAKWRFPATNISANAYVVVFASNKDRRIAGRPLHTNFRLDNTGEYLALVKPDGLTIVSAVAPRYPLQAADISYGIATVQSQIALVTPASASRFTVPLNGNLAADWIAPGFDDSAWAPVNAAVGFENNSTADPLDSTVVADSMADWSDSGVQGFNNWSYGFWIKTNSSLTYSASRFNAFPSGTGPHSRANFWDGAVWRWFSGEPPFDMIAKDSWRPSIYPTATTNGLEHQVIRRWVSEISGPISIEWRLAKKDPTGGGVTGRVFQNNASRDTLTLTGNNTNGQTKTLNFTVQAGDTIDFVLEPGTDIVGDETYFSAIIRGATTLANQFQTDVGTLMTNINSSAYLRIPFTVSNAAAIVGLRLNLRYDDGFAAYLNGSPLVSRHAPDPAIWNSTADGVRSDSDAVQSELIDLTRVLDLLHNGVNVLAIQGLNSSTTDGDFLIAPQLEATIVALDPNSRNYFLLPTPGSANGPGTATLGPIISRIEHAPTDPLDTDDLVVTARITPTFNTATNIQLYYRVMFGSEANVPMFDDGLHGDTLPGDGIYGASIPHQLSTFGEMIRYYIVAADTQGNSTREPRFSDPTQSSQYFGTVVQNPSLTNPLPVLHLFITPANLTSANGNSTVRAPCSIYYLGEFYDNIGINRHGQSSSGFPKKSYDIDFNGDHHFNPGPGIPRVDDVNLLTTYPDKAHIRNVLAYEYTFKPAGSPYHYVVPVRVQTNGNFYGDWHMVENGDAAYLKRIGRDPRGALYKVYNTFTAIGNTTIGSDPNSEKKTRKEEGNSDLVRLMNGMILEGALTNRVRYMYDNVDVAEVLNSLAARSVTSDWDCCHKNYYLYQDTEGTGEWQSFPWDIDLSFGRNWHGTMSYWDPTVYPENRIWGNWDNNGFFQVVLNMPLGRGIDATRQMYLRRVRTIMDELMQTNGTPASALYFEAAIDEWYPKIAPDAALDLARWGTWGDGSTAAVGPIPTTSVYYQSMAQSLDEMRTNYMPRRRAFIFDRKMGIPTEFPDAQPTNVTILVGSFDYQPSSGNQQEEYIELINTNNIAVDISGWKLSGAVEHTFQGGVVIPRGGAPTNRLYVVANKKAFRSRATAPRGGMSLYIEGPYKGQLSARGETVVLSDKVGRIVTTNTYSGNPSPAQQYLRVTEIMYHPAKAAPGASPAYDAEDYEYIELRNTGPSTLDLSGVRFTAGVEFSFTGSAITSLAPGAYVLVVRNSAAFNSRYGSSLPVAGQYIGSLDNSGENIQLDDAVGEKVMDFTFNNSWYPSTDGPGAALVIVDDAAPWDSWDLKASWRPSFHDLGSPAQADPSAAPPVLPILITEILTHTDLPTVDQIELYNPNSETVNIGGWFLSDDLGYPRKYRIPDGRTIAAGAYAVFTEADFNAPGSPTAFSLSSNGDEVYVFAGDGTGITGYFDGYSFEAAANGVSFGRYVNSETNIHFVAQTTTTLGGPNAGPKVGTVVISEINYRPIDLPGGVDNNVDEYVELANTTGTPVALFDPANPQNAWRIRGGVDLDLPGNITLPANGYVLLVNFNPAYGPATSGFRSRFNVPASVPLFGPFSGNLANGRDSLRLYRPDAPDLDGTVPYILVDAVDYSSALPWPAAADGIGPSLQRLSIAAYGNDPTNWTAVGPSAGAPFVPGGVAPTVAAQPTDTTGVVGRSASFSVGVNGTSPFFYQWRFNGQNIYGANGATLTLAKLRPDQSGRYSCVVFNSGGSTVSSEATLSIFYPPAFVSHPADVKVLVRPDPLAAPTTNVTFTAGAVSPGQFPIRYQWYFNGAPIANATNASYTVVGVTRGNYGQFHCTAADPIDTVESLAATLYPMVRPVAGIQPAPQTVPVGALFTLGFSYYGFPPPFTNEWRRGSTPILTTVTYDTNDVVTVRATATPGTAAYRAVVKNIANSAPGLASATATITTVADSDGDGIPDAVETALGLNPSDASDAAGDLDHDTMTNVEEYVAGTDPNNPLSYLKVEQATTPGTAIIKVAAVANRSYIVQYTDDLAAGQWNRLGGVVAQSVDRIEQLTDNTWTARRFYRIVLLLE